MTSVRKSHSAGAARRSEKEKTGSLNKLPEVAADEKWVVKKGEVISARAKAYLGAGASKGDVQRLINAMKAEPDNAKVFGPARKNGDLVYPGDEIKIPKAYVKASPAPAVGKNGSETLRASAATMADAADAMKKSGKPLSEHQLKRVREEITALSAAAESSGPADQQVLNRLRAHLPDGDALKAPSKAPVADTSTSAAQWATELKKLAKQVSTKSPTLAEWDLIQDVLNTVRVEAPLLMGSGEVAQLLAHAPPNAEARMTARSQLREWAIVSQGKQHTRDQRMAVGKTLSQFPDLAQSKAGKELVAQQPISPNQAKAELGAELTRVAAQVGDNTLSITEWSQVGYLVQQIARFAPALLETPDGKALKAKVDGVATATDILR